MKKILCNVEKVKTSYQDRKILILDCFVEMEDGGFLSVFNTVLDSYNEELKNREGSQYGCELIRQLLDFFGVDDLSEIKNYKCWLLTNKDTVWSSSDVLGFEQLSCSEFKNNQKKLLKSDLERYIPRKD